jgi:predicted Zn-dependent peptidase
MCPLDAAITSRKVTLPSGLVLVSERIPTVRSAALGVWVNAGSRDEGVDQAGMAHLVEHLLFKGTATRSARQIAMEMDALGGHLDAFTSREYTCFFVSVLDDRLEEGGRLLADIFLNSVFDAAELDRERGVVLEEIKMCHDNPEDALQDLTNAQIWGDHPLARPILGNPGSISSFTRGDVARFFGDHYHAGQVILTAVGNIDHDRIAERASEWFATAPGGVSGTGRSSASFRAGVVREERPLQQVYIDINLPGIEQTHPLRYAGHVLNTILGGSLSSRLFQKIREERGLAYSIYSGLASHADCGHLHISAGTSPKLAAEVTRLIVGELAELRHDGPSDEEIRRAKDHIKGTIVLSMESAANRMNKLGKQELYYGRYVSLEEVLREVEAVDRARVAEVGSIFFREGAIAYGFLGPAEGIPKEGDIPLW